MTTQYTPILQLALPVTGELNGTWGDVVNDNITSMVEEAIAGLATISTWTANSHTLTTADGVTDEARCAMLVATSTTAASNIICPNRTKLYVLKNSSSYAVTLKTAAGTGVAVAAGDTAFVFCDGTNVNACVTQIINGHITGNLAVDGNTTLGDASGDTVTINAGTTTFVNANPTLSQGTSTRILFLNGSKVIADAAGLTWDGTTMSATRVATSQVNITGQGDLRLEDTSGGEYVALQAPATLSASYTLTMPADDGTNGQALITDGAGNLSWSTAASGDVYGPASATDNAVTRFDGTTGKIIQNSGVIIDDSNNVTGVVNLTSSGSVTLSGGTANGVLYLNESKAVTSGSALTFDGTNVTLNGANNSLFNTSSNATFSVGQSAGTTGTFDMYGSGAIKFFTYSGSWGERMRLTSTGLGIGTSSPGYKLDVSGAAARLTYNSVGGPVLYLNNTQGTSFKSQVSFTANGASKFSFGLDATGGGLNNLFWYDEVAGATRMVLDASGNLGLGVTPSAWSSMLAFQVRGASFACDASINRGRLLTNAYFDGGGYKYIQSYNALMYAQNSADGAHSWYTAPSGTAGNAISFTQAMTLDASGRLSVGATSNIGGNTIESVSNVGVYRFTAAASGPFINLGKSRSGTIGTNTIVQDQDNLGTIAFYGANGTGYTEAAYIRSIVNGAPGASNDMPGALLFATTADGAGSATERMRLDSSGNVGIGTSSPTAGYKLDVAGNIYASSGFISSKNGGNQVYVGAAGQMNFGSGGSDLIIGTTAAPIRFGSTSTNTEWMRIDSSGNLLVGTTSAVAKLTVANTNASMSTCVYGNSNSQGNAQRNTIVRQYPVVSLGTKLIIPFKSQSSLNSTTICKVWGHGARYNSNIPGGFEVTFNVGHLNALYNLQAWGTGGQYSSIAVNGMNVEITFTSAYTASTADGIFVTIEYMTNNANYSIDIANIAMN